MARIDRIAVVVAVLVSVLGTAETEGQGLRTTFYNPTWGASATHVQTLHAMGFVSATSSMEYSYQVSATGLYRILPSPGFGQFFSMLVLPSGALVTSIELDGCDETAIDSMYVGILRNKKGPTDGQEYPVGGYTGSAPGCASFAFSPTEPLTIDNANHSYAASVEINLVPVAGSLRFKAVRVYYQLQISPAPVSATFGDVPVGAFGFKHVEALAASGITAGCGGGNFCPDREITRVEMAVFLAKALGLHWDG